jgi:hypothetical protein
MVWIATIDGKRRVSRTGPELPTTRETAIANARTVRMTGLLHEAKTTIAAECNTLVTDCGINVPSRCRSGLMPGKFLRAAMGRARDACSQIGAATTGACKKRKRHLDADEIMAISDSPATEDFGAKSRQTSTSEREVIISYNLKIYSF